MISAMLHNVAAFRANEVRIADAFGSPIPAEARRAQMEAESTANYDMGIGTTSMALLIPLMKAQLLASESRFGEALEIFNNVLEQSSPENLEGRKACFYADRAWCRLKLNQASLALADVDLACHHAAGPAASDDLVAAHARIAEILDQLGQRERSIEHKNLSMTFLHRHLDAQAELLGQLQRAFPEPPSAVS